MKRAKNMFCRRQNFLPLCEIFGLRLFSYDFLWLLAGQELNFYPGSDENCSVTAHCIGTKISDYVKKIQLCRKVSKDLRKFHRGRGWNPSNFFIKWRLEAVFMNRSSPNFVGRQRGISEHKFGISQKSTKKCEGGPPPTLTKFSKKFVQHVSLAFRM